jgi:hypothetical protein
MRTLFLLGVVLGIAAVVAAARFYPWVDPPRLRSETSVVANGGRGEQFLIRLPADRIGGNGSPDAGLRSASLPGSAALPEALVGAPLLTEHFKIRDVSGSVIGVAARHWTDVGGSTGTAWLLVIPSRGALMLTAAGEPRNAVDRALTASGWRAGEAWSGEITVTANSAAGEMRAGSREFDGLDGHYFETWKITGAGAGGEVQGTIELNTVTYGGPAVVAGNLARVEDPE